jgi:hypothetical protein
VQLESGFSNISILPICRAEPIFVTCCDMNPDCVIMHNTVLSEMFECVYIYIYIFELYAIIYHMSCSRSSDNSSDVCIVCKKKKLMLLCSNKFLEFVICCLKNGQRDQFN